MTIIKPAIEPTAPVAATINASLAFTKLLEPVQTDLMMVEEWLETNLVDDNPFIGELLSQIFQSGGKRIRPAIALLAARSTLTDGRPFSRLHIILAVLTELIHTASLVHDDVIDKADTRRGAATVNKKWNDRLAVLMGDLLFAQASICLARIMNPVVVGIYGQVLGDLCAGEIKQMRQQFNVALSWEDYLRKSINKTASLFAAGAHSGAILNAAPEATVKSLKEYGLNVGICFQIVDDLLDITGDSSKMGKPAGSDLRSGIITAPALYVLGDGSAASRRLEELIKTRQVVADAGSEEALSIIRANAGVERTVELANSYAQKGKTQLEVLGASAYRDSLSEILDYVLTRVN